MNMNKPMSILEKIRLFLKYVQMVAKTTLEYKLDRTFISIAIIMREMISVVVMYLILTRFIRIKGWEMNEMFFMYSFLFLSYSLFVFFFTGVRDFDGMIHSGEFDRFLIRPLGLMFQIIASRADYCATIGHGTVGIILLLFTANSVGIDWTFTNVLYYVTVLIGGAIIQASLFMLSSCFSFWAIRTENIRNLVFFNCRRFAGYPLSFYPSVIKYLLIYIIPFAFVNYFPTQFFIRKAETEYYWHGVLYLTPLVGVVMFFMIYSLWRAGLKRYSSTGTAQG